MNSRRFSSEGGTFRSRFSGNTISHGIIIAAVCLLCYSNTFQVPFQFDDSVNINEKPFVRDIGMFFDPARFSGDSVFIMRPVTYFTLAVNYLIHGSAVAGYHIVNISIHILNGLLVYFLVLLTFRTPYFVSEKSKVKSEKFFALASALLFVSHPIQTQAVTYIIQRAASLATLFFLLSLVLYIKWRISIKGTVGAYRDAPVYEAATGVPVTPVWRSMGWYLLSLLSAILAMKTKEIAFTLPLVIALYEFLFFSAPARKRIIYLLPLLLTMVIIPLSLISIGKPTGEIIGDVSEATKLHTDMSRWEYLFTQFRVIVTYIRLLFFPVTQNLDYDYPLYHSFFDPNVFLSFLFLLGIFGAGVYLVYRSRIDSRGNHRGIAPTNTLISQPSTFSLQPSFRLISFGIFWFFITLSVESGVIPIVDLIFEHRLYLPSIGFFIAVTAVLFLMWQHFKGGISPSFSPRRTRLCAGAKSGVIAVGVFGLILVTLSGATFIRNNVWRSEVSLWEDVVKKSPMKSRPHDNLGSAYADSGHYEKALLEFEIAVRLDPYNHNAHYNLGNAYGRQGRFEEAVRELQAVIQLAPDEVDAYNNLGLLLKDAGRSDEAVRMFKLAIGYDPDYDKTHNNLGVLYREQGRIDEAIEEFRLAIELNPAFAEARYNLGNAYRSKGDLDTAIRELQEAVKLKPGDAMLRYGLGLAYGNRGLLDQAISEFRAAIELRPGYKEAIANLEIALALKAKQ